MNDGRGLNRFLSPLERFPAESLVIGFGITFLIAVFLGPWLALATAGIVGFAQVFLVKIASSSRDEAASSAAESSAQALLMRGELNRMKSRQPYEDAETGVGSRRQFEVAWVRQFARQRRWGEPFSVAVFRVRDEDAPERALSGDRACVVAGVLLEESRAVDVVCRVDNDLFVVLLAASGKDGAQLLASRAANILENQPHPIDDGEVVFKVGIGVAEWQEGMTAAPEMVKLAARQIGDFELSAARAAREQRKAS